MRDLMSLPWEILRNIGMITDIENLFNLALTCSGFHCHLKSRLQKAQRCYEQNKIQHDRLPLTIPTLLRKALAQTEDRWQIRTIDIWEARRRFADWRNRMFPIAGGQTQFWGASHDETSLDGDYYTAEEYEMFRQIMRDDLNFDDEEVDMWSLKISSGWDEPVKGILFALLPKLTKLTFLSFHSARLLSPDFSDVKKHPLLFITQSIESVMIGLEQGVLKKWPPGFQSLREILVSTTSPYEHPNDKWYVPALVVASLFKLPNLKILHLSLAGYVELQLEDSWELVPCSSNVEELSFYDCRFWGPRTWLRFIMACRKLRKLFIGNLDISYGDTLFSSIQNSRHAMSLEYLWLECSYQVGLPLMARSFPNLKHLGLFKDTNLLQSYLCHASMPFRPQQTTHIHAYQKRLEGDNRAPYRIADLRQLLPDSIEVLQLQVETFRFLNDEKLLPAVAIRSELLRAVADLVEDPKFVRLQQVCLYELLGIEYEDPSVLKTYPWQDNITYEWDWSAFQRIEAKGVETHLHDEQGRAYTFEQHRDLHLENGRGTNCGLIESDPHYRRLREHQT